MIHDALEKVAAGENLTRAEAEEVAEDFFAGRVSHPQMSALMNLLWTKGMGRDEAAAIRAAEARHGRKIEGPAPKIHSEALFQALMMMRQGYDLSRIEASHAMEEILAGRADDVQIATFLAILRFKGETAEELAGFATAMRRHATPIFPPGHSLADEALVDTCGTGGDVSGTFNISTAAAFVVAGTGVRVAKHGNRSISSRCGSADVLEQLGARIDLPPGRVAKCIEEVGIGFLFAPAVHASTRHAMAARRELKIRTVFNLLGPLTNPSGALAQVVGVYDEGVTELMARALGELGVKRAFVVHGAEGLDEISISGETCVSELRNGTVQNYKVKPEDFGLQRAPLSTIQGGEAAQNAEILHKILGRSMLYREHTPQRDIVLANAAAALVAAGRAADFRDGVRVATESIDSGRAREKLDAFVEFTQRASDS